MRKQTPDICFFARKVRKLCPDFILAHVAGTSIKHPTSAEINTATILIPYWQVHQQQQTDPLPIFIFTNFDSSLIADQDATCILKTIYAHYTHAWAQNGTFAILKLCLTIKEVTFLVHNYSHWPICCMSANQYSVNTDCRFKQTDTVELLTVLI